MALRRLALLIGGENYPGASEAHGVEKDLSDLANHLVHPKGGSWDRDKEIRILHHQTRQLVLDWMKWAASNSDYCFISYSGHGCHYVDPLHETALRLSKNETILVKELNPRTKRQLMILDTCREFTTLKESYEERSKFAALSAEHDSLKIFYRRDCRKLFDSELLKCAENRVIAYACDEGQTAGDDEHGGYFTQALLRTAAAFHFQKPAVKPTATAVQTIRSSFVIARQIVQDQNSPQRPVLNEGRALSSFPFSVK